MSDIHDPPRDETLDRLLGEARAGARPDIDWNRVDVALFARVERDAASEHALAAYRGGWRGWAGLGGLAVMAAVAIALVPATPGHAPASASGRRANVASELTMKQGSGHVLVGGAEAGADARARPGQTIDTHGARALFESEGRVSWLLEDESSVKVEQAASSGVPLVLALARGAIEAQVAPVAAGEAFAVDVDGVRVAVHGTHLRVARDGERVIVDLSEGVVSIGAPPKMGSTYGTVVTAPAHVEFRADEPGALSASLSVSHDEASVRRVTDLSPTADVSSPPSRSVRSTRADGGAGEEISPARRPTPSWAVKAAPRASTSSPPPNPLADAIVASAVRACASGRPHAADVTVTVSSTLTIDVQDDGFARLASFDPPLAPDVQTCASHAIYATRFATPGAHVIPIALER